MFGADALAALFDLDGTLLKTGGAGKQAMDRALLEVLGLPEALAKIHLDGMTDRAIVREAVDALRLQQRCTEDEIDRVLERYLALLAAAMPDCASYQVLPGAEVLVKALHGRGWAVGLGTGNVERGARIKLQRSGLNPHFAFGGFGCDAEDRAALLAVGVQRASERLGRALRPEQVWIIGDTPKDIAAARAIGARVLAVATGRFSADELAKHQPDSVVAELSQVRFPGLA
jgi:phosphoglycolate phosphatase-like HAD superfamily hydrolase